MNPSDAAVVRRSIIVDAPIKHAFSVFTERFGDFKPPEHNMLGVPIAETVFEPHVGGHIYDRGTDGSECRWARVLAFEPPDRVVVSWDISPYWQIETDLDHTSEVEVRFVAENPERTRWNSSIATSSATGPAGKASATGSPTTPAGPCTSTASPTCSRSCSSRVPHRRPLPRELFDGPSPSRVDPLLSARKPREFRALRHRTLPAAAIGDLRANCPKPRR